jgi:hypothetical protein
MWPYPPIPVKAAPRAADVPTMSRRAVLRPLAALVAASFAVVAGLTGAGPASAALATPKSPAFGAYAEAFSRYEAPKTCATAAQPGTNGLKALIAATYPTRTFSSWRACSGATATSDHQEGRALDWMLSASNSGDRAMAASFIGWLFATDKYGNTYANARRLGIAYIIWNRQMWRAYNTAAGWQPYTGTVPHTDHIHLSLSWAGAKKQTTWWNPAISFNSPCNPATMHCNADGTVDVYTTPGYYTVSGRQWYTKCSAYSTTGTRCWAYIKASITAWNGRAYVTAIGWAFNNLTYTDVDSASWNANILAIPGYHISAGRRWQVSCTPDAASGPRDCTARIWSSVVAWTRTSSGTYEFGIVQKWVFNSVVHLHPAA